MLSTPPTATPDPPPVARPLGRGLRALPGRLRRGRLVVYLLALGPGLIAAASVNDAGAIATLSTTGADYGYRLLWVMLLAAILLAVVQETCARMGAVTGKGLNELIRERFGLRLSMFATIALFIANAGTTVTEFLGLGAAAELFGIPRWLAVPPLALLLWWLVTQGSYNRVERLFIVLSLLFLSYVVTAVIINPPWATVGQALVVPDVGVLGAPGALATVVALIGAMITPYVPLYGQAMVQEKGITPRDYKYQRVDTLGGVFFAAVVAVCIVLATAGTLFPKGQHVASASDAAQALAPVAGPAAQQLFGLGLFGASMLAAAVLPLATAYAVSESFGLERGVSFSFREAPFFMGLFTALIAFATVIAILPDIPIVALLLLVQVVNGVLLPIELLFILLLANDRTRMGRYANGWLGNGLLVLGIGAIVLAVGALFVSVLLPS